MQVCKQCIEIGDLVKINTGVPKDKTGTLVEKRSRGWVVELTDNNERIDVSFPMVTLLKKAQIEAQAAEEPQTETAQPIESSPTGNTISETDETEEKITGSASELNSGIKDMTIKQLQQLAKERGISIARTKEDFIRIIKEKNPEEDLSILKGKLLFDRVNQLHISRLRSKADLLKLLSN